LVKVVCLFSGDPLGRIGTRIGFFGFHTYNDFAELIRDARSKITTQLDAAKKDAEQAVIEAKKASQQVHELGNLAQQTSQSFAEVSKRLAEASTLGVEVNELKTRASDVQKQLSEASKINNEVKGLTSKVGRLEQDDITGQIRSQQRKTSPGGCGLTTRFSEGGRLLAAQRVLLRVRGRMPVRGRCAALADHPDPWLGAAVW
jgi:methyl-accepting chemotaxis protein